ncbi:putative UDP-N-acetylglucosamine pyrophosphorylase [Astathelohania contejeani]|uniref:UDP-N-acetylglucosamine diphosphorylase n=1 Tax=Astathelohania contejeani TaxID=164912 RepID=A0ABQ7HVV1_9MICR|nr:putative UDP-N-acetylglucosamine pyrophosphorylase [Thelohania contejeani]
MAIPPFMLFTPYQDFKLTEEGKEYKQIGSKAISENKVATLLLGGGQGTRLNSDGPKGCYLIEKINKTPFQIHAEKILERSKKLRCKSILIIMTSSYTHEETISYFKKHKNFGLDKIYYFKQGDLSCLDLNGGLLYFFDEPVKAPDGNGGLFKAITPLLSELEQEGITLINVSSVDNILANHLDPILVGYLLVNDLDILSKSVNFHKPENAGIFVDHDGNAGVHEYIKKKSERSAAYVYEEHKQANIANHLFTLEFIKRMGSIDLPIHRFPKKIPCIRDGVKVTPDHDNGIKQECFIFDAFHYGKSGVMNVPREKEFAPLKNSKGNKKDSPETCAEAYLKIYGKENIKFAK